MIAAKLGTAYYSTPLLELVTWMGFNGWQGVKCHHCGATHNVFCGLSCILCERCGECIALSWSGDGEICHKKPNYGWNASVLYWATENFGRYKEYLADTARLIASWKSPEKAKRKRKGRR